MLGCRIDRGDGRSGPFKVRRIKLSFRRRDRQDVGGPIVLLDRYLYVLHDRRQFRERMHTIGQLHVEFTVSQTFK